MSVAAVSARLARRPARGFPLVVVLIAVAVGIELDCRAGLAALLWCGLLGGSIAGWCLLSVGARGGAGAAAVCLLVAAAGLGGVWHHDRWHLFAANDVGLYADSLPVPVCLEVVAEDAPCHRPAEVPSPLSTALRGPSTQLQVRALRLRGGASWREVSGRAQLVCQGHLTGILPGDRLRVAGFLQRPRPPLNPGEPDYARMARGRRRLSTVVCRHAACVRRLAAAPAWWPKRWPAAVRSWAEATLQRYVSAGQAPLAAALLLGARHQLDERTVETFLSSGTLHVLAVSGLHLGVLASVFWFALRWLGWPHLGVLGLVATFAVAYALVTGLRPPVVRAAVLVVVFCAARGMGRHRSTWNVLAAAALFILGSNPAALREAGAQLSFLAVATILRVWPLIRVGGAAEPLDRLLGAQQPLWRRVAEHAGRRLLCLLLLSAAIWLVTVPLVAARFHVVAPAAIGLNLLLWAPVVVAMFTGLLTLAASVCVPGVASLAGSACGGALAGIGRLTSWAAAQDGWSRWVAGPPDWWLVGLYGGLAVASVRQVRLAGRWRVGLLAGWLAVGLAVGEVCQRAWGPGRGGQLAITFAAVGHGTSVLLELPDGRHVLYDAGRMGSVRSAAVPICSLLWAQRVGHLDAVVLSHADADHFNAVPSLLQRFSVGEILVSPRMFLERPPAVAGLRQAIRAAGVPLRMICEGDELRLGAGVRCQVWHPPPDGLPGGDNANSVVLMLTYRGQRVLLPGDLEAAGLDELLAEQPCRCTVVMAPHHGSLRSAPAELLRWADPRWIVISDNAGPDADRSRYHFQAAGVDVLHTGCDGAVRVRISAQGARVSSWNHAAHRWDDEH